MDGAAKKEDSLENGDEKVTLLGGKQRRDFIAPFAKQTLPWLQPEGCPESSPHFAPGECSWTCGAAEFLDDLAGWQSAPMW